MRHDEHRDVLRSVPVSVTTSICATLAVSVLALAASTLARTATACAALVSTAFCATASSAAADENGELVRRGGARSAAADNHERERAVLALAHEDKVPTEHALCLGGEVGACAHIPDTAELRLHHTALALLPAARSRL